MRGSSSRRPATTTTVQRPRQFSINTNIKILLGCCIVFAVAILVFYDGAAVYRYSTPRKGYSIVINTWKRQILLKKSISHYTGCVGVDSIHIVWSEDNPPSDSLRIFAKQELEANKPHGAKTFLRFELRDDHSLNSRFKKIEDLKTDAIFSVDDDIIISCSTLDFAFNVWQSAPYTMVGFVPRMHWLRDTSKGEGEKYYYGGWRSVWWTGTYSMVLSKAAFFHSKYLDLYTNHMPASIREYVTKNRNCEDIAMSFLVANVSSAPPIWVKGDIYDMGKSGISSTDGHTDKRSQCLNRFAEEYGKMPLLPSTVKAVNSRLALFW